MKIGMLVNNMDVSGGYHKLVIRLAQSLEAKGHAVVVYTLSVDKKNCYPDDINTVNIVDLSAKERKAPLAAQFSSLAKKMPSDLDVVIIHDPLCLYAVASLDFRRGTKVIWMLNNQFSPDDLNVSTKIERLKSKLPSGSQPQRAEEPILLRKGLGKVTNFVTYDTFNKKLVKKYLHKPATVVYAGADLHRFEEYAGSRTFEKKKTYTFLSVGVAFPHRRYEDLIMAAGILGDRGIHFKVVIVGRQDLHEEYANKLKALVNSEGADKYIEFKNYVTDNEMVKLYKTSDAFIFINDGFTWGISVFEAVAAKLPVVITNNIGAADLIKNGVNGLVVKPRSPRQVASAIEKVVNDRAKAKRMADKAYDDLTDFLTWEAYADRMLEVITNGSRHSDPE